MNAPDNPQAFPTGNPEQGGHDGMTLRDYFAGQAMNGIAGNQAFLRTASARTGSTESQLATAAYLVADAMLSARKEQSQ